MNTYIAIVFSSEDKAHEALRKLWYLDEEGSLTVHGAAVMRRDDMGRIHVGRTDSDVGSRTAVGAGIGALLGLLAGPMGMVAGAVAGAAIGVTADAIVEDDREDAAYQSAFTLKHGQSALVAEISEDWTHILDDAMKPLGGTVYRRFNNAAANAAFGPNYYGNSLYPYYYEPTYY